MRATRPTRTGWRSTTCWREVLPRESVTNIPENYVIVAGDMAFIDQPTSVRTPPAAVATPAYVVAKTISESHRRNDSLSLNCLNSSV